MFDSNQFSDWSPSQTGPLSNLLYSVALDVLEPLVHIYSDQKFDQVSSNPVIRLLPVYEHILLWTKDVESRMTVWVYRRLTSLYFMYWSRGVSLDMMHEGLICCLKESFLSGQHPFLMLGNSISIGLTIPPPLLHPF